MANHFIIEKYWKLSLYLCFYLFAETDETQEKIFIHRLNIYNSGFANKMEKRESNTICWVIIDWGAFKNDLPFFFG